jgi:hypothetical protein
MYYEMAYCPHTHHHSSSLIIASLIIFKLSQETVVPQNSKIITYRTVELMADNAR